MNQDQEITPQVESNIQTLPKKKNHLVLALVFILVILVTSGGAFYIGKKQSTPPQNTKTEIKTTQGTKPAVWEKLPSTQIGFPIVDVNDTSGVLKVYSAGQKKTVSLDKYKIISGSGESGLGESSPQASPNRLYTAFISKDNDLWLLSNETLEAKQLTTGGFVTYITDWSGDSTKVLYYYSKDSIQYRQPQGDGGIPTTIDFKSQTKIGFYQFNIETGESVPLAALDYVEKYIDSDRVIAKINAEDESLVVFNTKTMQSDQSLVKGTYGFGQGQYDFSNDGTKWTYTNSKHPTDDAEIVLGSFPAVATKELDAGGWADVQHSRLSPDSTKVAYWKKEGFIAPGIPNYTVWVYDTTKNTKAKYGTGQLVDWLDNSTVVVRVVSANGAAGKIQLLDLASKQTTEIYSY